MKTVMATPRQQGSMESLVAVTNAAPRPRRLGRYRTALALVVVGSIIGGVALRLLYQSLRGGEPVKARREMTITQVTNSGKVGTSSISPDGKLIAYTQNYTPGKYSMKGTGSLYVQQTGSNHEVQLLEPGERLFGNTEFSRDGAYIYYEVYDKRDPKGALYRINALGGPPIRLFGDLISMFSLSPDGSRVTFYRHDPARKQLRLLITELDGTNEQTLLTRPYSDIAFTGIPAWSPDGRLIAFVPELSVSKLDKNEPETIYAIDLEGHEMKPLTGEHWAGIGKIIWTADGRGLIFIANRAGTGNQLYYLSYPEGEVRRITNDLHSYGNYGLGITADGSALVAETWESQTQLWVVGADGDSSRALQLTNGMADGRRGTAWLADGRIVYVTREGSQYDLWTIRDDGTDAKALTADSFIDTEVAATPDGRFLVFTSDRAGGSHIFRAEADGTRPQQLTSGEAQDSLPDCSPDGQWVVYASTLDEKTTVWKVSIEGGTPLRLTDYECLAPSFSPDGRFISCIIPSESQFHKGSIAIVPAEGGQPVKSFNVMPFFWSYLPARWTPDGQALVFRDSLSYVTNLLKQPLAGGPVSQLTDFKTDIIFNYAFSRDGEHLILARGRTVINVVLVRDFR
jgi:Tol biopolymer transport system component